jgi:sugar phosphate isomerase/epimerase
MGITYDERRPDVNSLTICVVDALLNMRQPRRVLDTDELLARLASRGVRNVEIARVLDLPDSRVPEIKDKRRALKLEEAVKLTRAFGLEQDSPAGSLPPGMLRLVVLHVAQALGVPPERTQAKAADLAEDLRAFAEFVADPKVRQSLDAAEGFFRAMAIRPRRAESEAPPESDPERTH